MRAISEVSNEERHALVQTLLEVGPEAPTLCAGWTAQDVCIHLVLYQRRPDAWFGVQLGNRSSRLDRFYTALVERERERPWHELVERFRVGPRVGLLARDSLRDKVFFREHVVHHEDVRRANGMPVRSDLPDVQRLVWGKLPGFARLLGPKDLGLQLSWPGVADQVARKGSTPVTLTGEPVELLLHLFGRSGAVIELTGSPEGLLRAQVRDTSVLAALPRVRVPAPSR